MLTHQPDFLTRHVLGTGRADPLGRGIRNAHAHGSKAGRQASPGSLAPTDLSPLRAFEHEVRSYGFDLRHMVDKLAMPGEQMSLGLVDRSAVRIDFPL